MTKRLILRVNDVDQLFVLDTKQSLEENVRCICKAVRINENVDDMSLKLTEEDFKPVNLYLTTERLKTVAEGKSVIELAPSVKTLVFDLEHKMQKDIFPVLDKHSHDPMFLKELVAQDKCRHLENWLRTAMKNQQDDQQSILMKVIRRLVTTNDIKKLDDEMLKALLADLRSWEPPRTTRFPECSLDLLQTILLKEGDAFMHSSALIHTHINVTHLLSYLKHEEHRRLQSCALSMIVTMLTTCRMSDGKLNLHRQKSIIQEVIVRENMEKIYTYVIKPFKYEEISANVKQQLAYLQVFILSSLYVKKYQTPKEVDEDDFGCVKGMNTVEILKSIEGFSFKTRYSSESTPLDSRHSISTLRESVDGIDVEETINKQNPDKTINQLTHESLAYYRRNHSNNFNKSKIEEHEYQFGIYQTSFRVTNMLVKILEIGRQVGNKDADFHPLVFITHTRNNLFYELFSSTMWILSKTRQEMKAHKKEDYDTVFRILEQQIILVLQRKPYDYKDLEKYLIEINYRAVCDQWVQDQALDWIMLYKENPAFQQLKERFRNENIANVNLRRINIMKKGNTFPTVKEKKGKLNNTFTMTLSKNEKTVYLVPKPDAMPGEFDVNQIRHVIVGNACALVKTNVVDARDAASVFSLQLEGETYVNIVAKTSKIANIWIDGFNILLDHPNRSEDYNADLETLVHMDCALQTLELQNISIPSEPPPVPKPIPPPKPSVPIPQKLIKRNSVPLL